MFEKGRQHGQLLGELARIRERTRRATQRVAWAEYAIAMQAESPTGFSEAGVNKRLGLAFLKARSQEMLSEMDARHVRPEDLALYQPLVAVTGTGFTFPHEVKRWIAGGIQFTEDLLNPERSWIALQTVGRRGQQRVLVVEASEPELDHWIRYRRSSRTNQQGYHSALPFLLNEESLLRSGSEETLARLSRALVRGR